MKQLLHWILRTTRTVSAVVPPGDRVYAIGDIHGCYSLLEDLLNLIEQEERVREPANTTLVFLGDLIDRGPCSRQVVERVIGLQSAHWSVVVLSGNHEEILVEAYRGDRSAAALFNRVGGRETLISYGVSPEEYDNADIYELIALIRSFVPREHVSFLESLQNYYEVGGYLFAHAGIRPGTPLNQQKIRDLRWIRREFLDSVIDHGKVVVHGHSASDMVDERSNRIGIDTGAYRSGRLTALVLEGERKSYLQACEISDS